MVLKVSSSSPLLFNFVSFLGDGGISSLFPFFFPGDCDFARLPDELPILERLRSSCFACFAAASAAYIRRYTIIAFMHKAIVR